MTNAGIKAIKFDWLYILASRTTAN